MAKTVIINIRNNRFDPMTVEVGSYIIWRNLDPYVHSAETNRGVKDYFNAGAMMPGDLSSPVLFAKTGAFDYLCRYHHGMVGQVVVMALGAPAQTPEHEHGGHDEHGGEHLKHFHGFVTGGRSAQRMYMTHTPVLADERHHYQIILQCSLSDPKHAEAYEKIRTSPYSDGKVQLFHDHFALADIGSGRAKEFPQAEFRYYPNDPEGVVGETSIPGLEENIPVRIDKVLHFHQFNTDADYPDALTYVMYGDAQDIFIDHYIDRAPSFHSVARLKQQPSFFTDAYKDKVLLVSVPSKPIRDVSPKILRRVAFVDNAFHLFWLPPPGVYPLPTDPLRPRVADAVPKYDVVAEDGQSGEIEVGRFLHFDVRLLNYGVLIV